MDRTACVDLPAFPLQLLMQQHDDWRGHPVAVVDQDKPQGKLLWVNEQARALRVLPGMRYASALAQARQLRAAEVPRERIERAIDQLLRQLRRFTPHVEASRDEPGVFWLDAAGLERLYPSLRDWAESIRIELSRSGFESTLIVGFARFGSYALAKSKRGMLVLQAPEDECAAARRVPLDRLALIPEHRETLRLLGIRTLGAFIDLPPDGLESRFDADLHRLHRVACGALGAPLQPEPVIPPAAARRLLDHAETDAGRLLYLIEELLQAVLQRLEQRGESLAELWLRLHFESKGLQTESIRPAAPTRNTKQLMELLALRLQAIAPLPRGVEEIGLVARGVGRRRKQLELFAERPRRDLAAANRALARVRAELGDDAVVVARLRDGHLPEARFRWERLESLGSARPREVEVASLVRRMLDQPQPLPPRPRHAPDGWMLRGLTDGPVTRVMGPYVVSGGWWRRPIHREYLFAETQKGELLWVYYDRLRRRWYQQGRIE